MVKREQGQMRERAKLKVKKEQRGRAVFCVRDLCGGTGFELNLYSTQNAPFGATRCA